MDFLHIIYGIFALITFFIIKSIVWDKPHEEIDRLYSDIEKQRKLHEEELFQLRADLEKIQKLHEKELSQLQIRLQNSSSLHIQENEFADIVVAFAWRELFELCHTEYASLNTAKAYSSFIFGKNNATEFAKQRFREAVDEQYKYRYLIYLYPELAKAFDGSNVKAPISALPETVSTRSASLFEIVDYLRNTKPRADEFILLKNRVAFLEASRSNLTAIPYMAKIMADYETYGLEHLAKELDWGRSLKRQDKVKAIRDIRKDAQAIVEKYKASQYQLEYLLKLFPNLEDVIEAEFSQLPAINVSELSDRDSVRDFLSKEEYSNLSETERNQLALDRYKNSHHRTKWQIGRDYELYVGYEYTQKGYDVDYFGSYMGLEDLGRDLIAKKSGKTLIIQCKYWSSKKQIHENHVNQLYGTMISYCIEHKITKSKVKAVLVTNIELSPMAKKIASYLGVDYIENHEIGDYPCIKCNIGHDSYGNTTKIYHLPFDQQYDTTKIKDKGEFYAVTVAEAEAAGFRRAFTWLGS